MSSPVRGSITDPDFRHRRAVHAASARVTLEHYVEKIVARAPELTAAQRDKLALLLRGTS